MNPFSYLSLLSFSYSLSLCQTQFFLNGYISSNDGMLFPSRSGSLVFSLPPPSSIQLLFSWMSSETIPWPHHRLSCAPLLPSPLLPKLKDGAMMIMMLVLMMMERGVRNGAAAINHCCCHVIRQPETSGPLQTTVHVHTRTTHAPLPCASGLQRLICTATAPMLLYCWANGREKEEKEMKEKHERKIKRKCQKRKRKTEKLKMTQGDTQITEREKDPETEDVKAVGRERLD